MENQYIVIIIINIIINLSLFIITLAPAPVTETPTDLAERCDTANCQLPYCFCSRDGTLIPGGLAPEDVSI